MTTAIAMLIRPMSILGEDVTTDHMCAVMDGVADVPLAFISMDIVGPLPDHGWHWKQEAANRILQRWRKIGLAQFNGGRWTLTKGAWDTMQDAVRMVRFRRSQETAA